MEHKFKINGKKKPGKYSEMWIWYDRLKKRFGTRTFTQQAAEDEFFKYTCSARAHTRFLALVGAGCVVKMEES